MRELPPNIEFDHLPEVRRCDGVVEVCSTLGFIERAAKGLARQRHAETAIQRDKPVEPMQAVAIERAAHIEKDRANHPAGSLLDDSLASKRRSALPCPSQR